MYKAVLFDLDGTILNTLDDLYYSTNYALSFYNLPNRTYEEIRTFVGNGVRVLIEKAVGENNLHLTDLVIEKFKEHYQIHSQDHIKEYEGITELLKNLKQKGLKLAVVTNKFNLAAQDIVNKHFPSIFDIVLGESAKLKRKPYPDMCNYVLEQLNLTASDALYVGDSDVDIKTAANANLKCISCSWGFKTKEELLSYNAKIIIDNPSKLLKYLKSKHIFNINYYIIKFFSLFNIKYLYKLGLCYEEGKYCEKDILKSINIYKNERLSNYKLSLHRLANIYFNEMSMYYNLEQGEKIYVELSSKGDLNSQNILIDYYLKNKKIDLLINHLKKCMLFSNSNAYFQMALLIENNILDSTKNSLYYFNKGAQLGDYGCQYVIIKKYFNDNYSGFNIKELLKYMSNCVNFNSEINYYFGLYYYSIKLYELAFEYLIKCSNLNLVISYNLLCYMLYNGLGTKKDIANSLHYAKLAVELKIADFKTYNVIGKIYLYYNINFEKAYENLIFSNQLNPSYIENLIDLATFHYKNNEILKTYSYCQKIITLDEKNVEVYYLLSLVYLNKNCKIFDLKTAKQIYMKYFELSKGKFKVNLDLAKLFYNKGSKNDLMFALRLFKKILETDEFNEDALLNIALIYKDLNDGDIDENAAIFLKRVLVVNSNNFIALKNLGIYNLNRNDIERFSEGIMYLEQAREIKNDEQVFLYLCVSKYIYNTIKKNQNTIQYYLNSPINLNSGNTLFLLGRLYDSGIGVEFNLEKSFKYFKKAADLNYVKSFYYVAECYEFGRGTEINMDKAIEYYNKAIFYNDPDAYNALQRLNKL